MSSLLRTLPPYNDRLHQNGGGGNQFSAQSPSHKAALSNGKVSSPLSPFLSPVLSQKTSRKGFTSWKKWFFRCLMFFSLGFLLGMAPFGEGEVEVLKGRDFSFGETFVVKKVENVVAEEKDNSKDFVKNVEDDFVVMDRVELGAVDAKIRFERLVRASAIRFADSIYYLTLEGTDEEKGDLNIYYAVVVDFLSIKTKKVIRWQLVDESFSYPFQETRFSELHKKEQQQDSEVSDSLTRAWLMGMALQSKDDRTYATYFDFGENSPGIINFCPPWAQKKNMDPLSTVASDTMVPVDVKNNKKICKYALSAVKIYKKKDDCVELDLKEVWGASKSVVDSGVFYLLLFNAVYDELNNYCAIIKVLGSKVELMMLHNVESYVNPP